MADAGHRVTGLDRSDDMIARARSDHPGLDLLVGDATLLPSYDDAFDAFDAVVAASIVNVGADAQVVLSEMHRVCASGGTVSVLVHSTDFTDADLLILRTDGHTVRFWATLSIAITTITLLVSAWWT